MKLLIVESPSKIKTVSKALGKDYKVMASSGHIVDLPKSKLGIDVENGFAPQYQNMKNKTELLKDLVATAKKAKQVYLATDPDREGEAISWHLANILNIDQTSDCRVVFNEITETAIRNGIAQPRRINHNLVDAQQARRVLDRLVGYEISPVLWRKVKTGLSAGRVQSPTVRLIVDREREIENFIPKEYWSLDARLSCPDGEFTAAYYGSGGKKTELENQEQTEAIMAELNSAAFTVSAYKEGTKKRSSPTPFTTSTLQQEASRKLGFTTRKTMKIAQDLYEGVEIEGGSTGLVTYIRTDSMRIAAEAITEVRSYIAAHFDTPFLPAKPKVYKGKKNAQDAHEAIRPTSLALEPKAIRKFLSDDQYKLYKLIFERFVACQMSDAQYATINVDIAAKDHLFKSSSQQRVFDGYMAAYIEGKNDKTEENKNIIPRLKPGQILQLLRFDPAQHFTEPPARYNEASLVKELEENGIGRPSTYASIISTILDREYIEREKKTLRPTMLGRCVVDFMMSAFPNIVDVRFTANMEGELDKVEDGTLNWTDIMQDFYAPFHQTVEAAADVPHVKIPVIETDIPCDKCGSMMVVRSSRFGKFLACPGYPECKNTKPMPEDEVKEPCPKCGAKLIKRLSKKTNRKFYGCSGYPDCDFAASGPPTGEICPECGGFIILGFRGRKMCMNLDCPTRAADKAKYEKKLAKAAEAEKAAGADKATEAKKTAGTKKAASSQKAAKTTKTGAAKKTTTKKTTAKKATDEKTTAGKATTKKTTTAKSTPKKTTQAGTTNATIETDAQAE